MPRRLVPRSPGIIKLGDQHALVEVAVNAALPAIRKRAFGELRDPRALAELAKGDGAQDLRLAAVGRIDDGDVLRALAIDTTQKEVGLAAVEKLDDTDRLENVAQKAKNKAVRQRARKIVTEMAEAEQAKKPGLPDDVKRRRAEGAAAARGRGGRRHVRLRAPRADDHEGDRRVEGARRHRR